MKTPHIPASLHQRVRGVFHRKEEPLPYTPMPPIHEDLGGLNETEIEQEIRAIERRIELGIVQPEGLDGLNYRLTRLQAQGRALKRKKHEQSK